GVYARESFGPQRARDFFGFGVGPRHLGRVWQIGILCAEYFFDERIAFLQVLRRYFAELAAKQKRIVVGFVFILASYFGSRLPFGGVCILAQLVFIGAPVNGLDFLTAAVDFDA